MLHGFLSPSPVSRPTGRSLPRRVWLSLFSILVIASFVLAACGSSTPGASNGPVTLTFGWWSNTPAKDNSMKAWIGDFEKAYPNIKVNAEIIPWGNYWTKLQTTAAGGNAYDLVGVCSCMAAPYYNTGEMYDLSTFSDYQTAIQNLSAGPLALTQWGGKSYGLPIGTSVSLLGYNKDLLTKAGVPFPDPSKPMTFAEFKAMAQKLTVIQNGKGVQYALNPNDIVDYDTLVRMEGGSVYDNPVNPTKITINSPQGIQGLTDYASLFTDHIAPPYDELASGPWSFDLGALQTGKIGFARVGAWLFSDIQKAGNIGVAPLFTINQAVVTGGANSLSIYKGSKHPQEAWQFLKWATQTQPEISFAKFSDIPADKTALSQMSNYIQPSAFVPTLLSALPTFQPSVMTTKQQLSTTLGDIITDMVHGKLTPAQAAAKMEQQGNAVLAGS